ncbi:MAG: UDP-N-acetylmuramoyl-L-alanyl-D-glutamate--2,6-diaminopimelate ligase [Armatimonadetes bacterium]|nr:UDP-N-acetylmuramoyl-L-alanyl-D-glutamate--2,6-diaminopimelate ligase [Armatimonadota bacterium]
MKLEKLVESLEEKKIQGNLSLEIKEIQYDSRKVTPNSLFVCIKGKSFNGNDFAKDVINKGVKALVFEKKLNFNPPLGATLIKVQNSRYALTKLARKFFNFPDEKLKIIGVTGTNGKTTITFLLKKILEVSGFSCGLIGTLHAAWKDKIKAVNNTTPNALEIQKFLFSMLKDKIEYVAMEVSSHGLDQERVYEIPFLRAVFTNLTQDHLDYHKNLENYFQAKLKLFYLLKKEGQAIVNLDDPYGRRILKKINNCFTYGIKNQADFFACDIKFNFYGTQFKICHKRESRLVKLPLLGLFNVYNSLAASAAAFSLGIDLKNICLALEEASSVKGRFESINLGQNFRLVVDYAHTPAGLENILKGAKILTKGRLIVVFGAGGDRDRGKRPLMGEAASKLADLAIITSDNPRGEDPLKIIKEVKRGFVSGSNYLIEADRKEAIRKAINLAKKDDFIVIAGKGHENYQIFKDKVIHFDDFEVAEKFIKKALICCP